MEVINKAKAKTIQIEVDYEQLAKMLYVLDKYNAVHDDEELRELARQLHNPYIRID